MSAQGRAIIGGFVSGRLKDFSKSQPIIRFVIMEPNTATVIVCINEEPQQEEWYQIDVSEIEDQEELDLLHAMIESKGN